MPPEATLHLILTCLKSPSAQPPVSNWGGTAGKGSLSIDSSSQGWWVDADLPPAESPEAPICSTTVLPLPCGRATSGPRSRPAAWCCPPGMLLTKPQASLGAPRLYTWDFLGSLLFLGAGCISALLWLWLSNVRQDRRCIRQRNVWWASGSAWCFQTSIHISARQLAHQKLTAHVPGCSDLLTCKQMQSFNWQAQKQIRFC